MPIGYMVGQQYRLDTNFDRYGNLEVYKKLVALAGKQQLSCHVFRSAMTREYCCEIRQLEQRFRNQTSMHIYYHVLGHKYSSDPLSALLAALRVCMEPSPLFAVLCLEAEAQLLKIEYHDRVALEKRLDGLLEELKGVISGYILQAIFEPQLSSEVFLAGVASMYGQKFPAKIFIVDEVDSFTEKDDRPDLDDDL